MSKSHKYAWAAGFIDGDGYISIQRRKTVYKDKVYRGHYLRVGVNHVASEPLEELQKLFGGTLKPRKTYGNRKPQLRWQINCSKAAEVLEQILPYMINKVEAAKIGLELHKTMDKNIPQDVREEQYSFRETLRDKLININARD